MELQVHLVLQQKMTQLYSPGKRKNGASGSPSVTTENDTTYIVQVREKMELQVHLVLQQKNDITI